MGLYFDRKSTFESSKHFLKITFISIISDDCLHAFFYCTDNFNNWPENEKYCRKLFDFCENNLPLPSQGVDVGAYFKLKFLNICQKYLIINIKYQIFCDIFEKKCNDFLKNHYRFFPPIFKSLPPTMGMGTKHKLEENQYYYSEDPI